MQSPSSQKIPCQKFGRGQGRYIWVGTLGRYIGAPRSRNRFSSGTSRGNFQEYEVSPRRNRPHMASRDGELRTRRRNSNIIPRAGQIAVLYGSQIFMVMRPFNRELLRIQPQDSKTPSSKPWSGIQFCSCKTSVPRTFPVKRLGGTKVGTLWSVHWGRYIGAPRSRYRFSSGTSR